MPTDAAGSVVWRAYYEPFGAVSSITGSLVENQRFPGQWFQLEAGLNYNWHRHYDPTLGRYTTPDPLGTRAGASVYGYVRQNPLLSSDPTGLQEILLSAPPEWLSPLEALPRGSSGGPGEGLDFPRNFTPQPGETPDCIYCGRPTSRSSCPRPDRYNNDHIVPKSAGGNNSPDNLAPSCQDCNLSKGPRTPEEWYNWLHSGGA